MKINGFRLANMRNDEHFQFYSDFIKLVNGIGAATLKIEAQFAAVMNLFDDEDAALKKIMKSAITPEIQKADKDRDTIFRGMTDAYKSALNHFNELKSGAAKRLKPVFDTYGNLAIKPINEQSSGITNMLQEFTGKYAADCQTIGIDDWAAELAVANNAVIELMHGRYDEGATRTDIVLKEARAKVDEAYRVIVERVNALLIIEGEALYADFVRRLNIIVDKYANTIAQRLGSSAADKKKKEEAAANNNTDNEIPDDAPTTPPHPTNPPPRDEE